MTEAVVQILEKVAQLSPPERAELADRLIETLGHEIPPEIERAQLDEVKRRIAEVRSGAVKTIPGDQALAEVRRLVEAARHAS
jgi:putative addiction module component (TIGR02574 family)